MYLPSPYSMLSPNDQESARLISALGSAIDLFKNRGSVPNYASFRKSQEHHWPDDAANYKKALTAYNEAANKLTEATSKVEEWLPEPIRQALTAGEAFITRMPGTAAAPVSYLLLDKPNGVYRVIKADTMQEVLDKHKSPKH
jgi:hypothetical protein